MRRRVRTAACPGADRFAACGGQTSSAAPPMHRHRPPRPCAPPCFTMCKVCSPPRNDTGLDRSRTARRLRGCGERPCVAPWRELTRLQQMRPAPLSSPTCLVPIRTRWPRPARQKQSRCRRAFEGLKCLMQCRRCNLAASQGASCLRWGCQPCVSASTERYGTPLSD